MPNDHAAPTDQPLHDLIRQRWSPYSFDGSTLEHSDVLTLLEAARWAPSCFNEQPWRYLVAMRQDTEAFEQMVQCLVEGNQPWAKHASVLMIGCISTVFARNDKPNKHAGHDLGLASAQLTVQATSMGLFVHQMGGIVPSKIKAVYKLPEQVDPLVGIAIGRHGNQPALPDEYKDREKGERKRKPLSEVAFTDTFGNAFE